MSPEQLGIYGLFTVSISYSLYLLGLDFYAYAQREMLSQPREEWRLTIFNQLAFYSVTYLVMLPVLLTVFYFRWIPLYLIGWFYILLVFEHISQELYRILIAFEKLLIANVTLFLRSGSWTYAAILVFWLRPDIHNLTPIWIVWSIGSGLSIIIAYKAIINDLPEPKHHYTLNWPWIRRGLTVASKFILGTLSLRALFTVDRYIIDHYIGKTAVGVFSLYMGIVVALIAFTDAGVISRLYPSIVSAYRCGKHTEYKKLIKELFMGISIVNIICSGLIVLLIKPILHYVGHEIYLEQITVLWVLLIAICIFNFGMIPHYMLYARSSDKSILAANVLSLVTFCSLLLFQLHSISLIKVAYALLIAVSCQGFIKLMALNEH